MIRFCFSLTTLLLIVTAATADPPDADHPFMGEYHGSVNADGKTSRAGLQVVALGNGEFTGMAYGGGLPGSGWDQKNRIKVSGNRTENTVTLTTDEGHKVTLDGLYANVQDKDGNDIGRLKKVIRSSATLGAYPPEYSIVLFDGHGTQAFKDGKVDDEGYLKVGTELLPLYGDFTLHMEFRIPYYPERRGQHRGNSGLYINSRYEVQILDSFGLEGLPNECGGLYRQKAADQNMALPPGSWQTYDIRFRSPKFDSAGEKTENARITVRHNNVVIHDDYEIIAKTGAGKKEAPNLLPTKLQDHASDVQFRNMWLIDHSRGTVCEPIGPAIVIDSVVSACSCCD
ncbi:MAG: DUF1080 domain-containing protein [Planctomycetales bacterium]|nr:DUF1080 domain-containing protein [Planctomycetales bacterium]